MDNVLNALKEGKEIIINSIAYDVAGNKRDYTDSIAKVSDIEILNHFNTNDLYNMRSQTILSNDYFDSLERVKKEIEKIKENSIKCNISITE